MSFDLTKDLRGLNAQIRNSLADVGGVKSPEMKATAGQLAKHMRKVLSTKGGAAIATSLKTRKLIAIGGRPSAPGQPPHRQTAQLAKSVKTGIVGDGIRVGPLRFTALMLEAGVDATLGRRKTRSGRGGRRRTGNTTKRTLRIEPRPYLLTSVDRAKDDMAKAFGDLAGLSIKASTR